MLMIRFQRIGRKNDPSFRMVVLEKASGPRAGNNVAVVGTYNPKTKQFAADGEQIKMWLGKGAQLSPSLSNLLIAKGVLEGKKTQVISTKNLEKNKAKAEEAAAAAAAAPAATEEAAVEEAAVEEAVAAADVVEEPAAEAAPEAEVVAEAPVEAEAAPAA